MKIESRDCGGNCMLCRMGVIDDPNLRALYEIAEMLGLSARSGPPSVEVPRAVREHLEKLRAMTDALCWTGQFKSLDRWRP